MRYLLGDKSYYADILRRSLRETGAAQVIPGRRNRKRTIRYDKQRNRGRHLVESTCPPEGLPPRRDKLAGNFLSAIALATAVAFWL